jgi:ribosomal protein S18 acetylase RimI-like enzyme
MEHKGYIPGRSGEIDDIWVEPEHRQKGLAHQLLLQLSVFFRQHGLEHVILRYAEGNHEARELWSHYGFHKVIVTATTSVDQFVRLLES